MQPCKLEKGDVVQISPRCETSPAFRGCLMVVTDPKSWGAVGYVKGLGTRHFSGAVAYTRVQWSDMEDTEGSVEWNEDDAPVA